MSAMSFKTLRNSFRVFFFPPEVIPLSMTADRKMQIEVIYKVKKRADERTVHTENTEDI